MNKNLNRKNSILLIHDRSLPLLINNLYLWIFLAFKISRTIIFLIILISIIIILLITFKIFLIRRLSIDISIERLDLTVELWFLKRLRRWLLECNFPLSRVIHIIYIYLITLTSIHVIIVIIFFDWQKIFCCTSWKSHVLLVNHWLSSKFFFLN